MSDNATSLKKPLRLRKRAEFLAVRQGEKRRGKLFLLEVKQRDEAASKISKSGDNPRVGFTVTKKNGNAVIRNRIRRRLKAAVSAQAGIYMDKSTDYVIVARRDVLNAPFTILTSELVKRIKQPASRNKKTAE